MAQGWEGTLLGGGAPSGREPCEVRLEEDALVAHCADGRRVALPLETLRLERQGLAREVLAFRTQDTLQPCITTRAAELLTALTALPVGRTVVGVERAQRRRTWVRYALMPITTLALLSLLSLWLVTGPLVSAALAAIPPSVDVQLGELALEGVLDGREVKDARVVEPVRALLAPLLAVRPGAAEGAFIFDLRVVRDTEVNAYALPGGKLIVTTGLLREVESAAALTGVLAHEVSHVTGRHAMRGLLKQVGLWALLAVVVGDVSGLNALLLQQSAVLTRLAFSRDMEREADREGVALLTAAGMDPTGLRTFLASLRQHEKDAILPALLSTHPLTEDRLAELDALLVERSPLPTPPPRAAPPAVDFAALRAAVGE